MLNKQTITESEPDQACTECCYTVTHKDLPLSCPPRNLRVWDSHPRVYLPIEQTGKSVCPYCNAEYILTTEPENL